MKIAVIAAQGRSGRAFVEAALAAGHEIVAGIRGDNPFDVHEKLSTKQCDATNATQVKELIAGTDAVVSMIGHVKGSEPFVQTDAMRIIAAAMKEAGITRIVTLTGTGAREPGDMPNWLDKVLNITIQRIDPDRIADGISHVNLLEHTNLDWTVIRVLKLTSGKVGPFNLNEHGPAKLFTSRAEVAHAAVRVLEEGSFIKGHPVIIAA